MKNEEKINEVNRVVGMDSNNPDATSDKPATVTVGNILDFYQKFRSLEIKLQEIQVNQTSQRWVVAGYCTTIIFLLIKLLIK